MAYRTHQFRPGDKLKAEQLNEMDEQIAKNEEASTKLKDDVAEKLPKSPSSWPVWSDAEKETAQQIIGLKKEWQLKGTLATASKDSGVRVDLTGCTELLIYGTATATGNVAIAMQNNDWLTGVVFTAGTPCMVGEWCDEVYGIKCTYCRNGVDAGGKSAYMNTNGFCLMNGQRISGITTIKFSAPASVTACNVKIYAK